MKSGGISRGGFWCGVNRLTKRREGGLWGRIRIRRKGEGEAEKVGSRPGIELMNGAVL